MRETLFTVCGKTEVATLSVTPKLNIALGSDRISRCGLANELAAPNSKITEAIISTSCNAVVKRWEVTAPPIRIPTIQLGNGNSGILKITVPGMGTPISSAIPIRIMTIKKANFTESKKVLLQ